MGADVETDSHGTLSCVLWQRKELGGAESSKEGIGTLLEMDIKTVSPGGKALNGS